MGKKSGDLVLNIQEITWDPYKVERILKAQTSPEAKAIITKYSNQIYKDAKPKLPSSKGKRYSKYQKLKDAMILTDPTIKKKNNSKFGSYEIYTAAIKPKKRQKYYYVVMSGKNTYNGKKVSIKYSNSNAESFPVEKAYKKYKESFLQESKQLIYNICKKV